MANQWLRLWHDMPTDPKWRTIAKASGQAIGNVIAVYVHMLVCASNANERGRTQSFNSEDVASALDMETEQVEQIVTAMQGRVMDGDMLKGWAVRQVAREDGSAERSKAWRDAKKQAKQAGSNDSERNRTHSERKQTPDKDTDTDKKEGKPSLSPVEPATVPTCPHQQIINLYAQHLPNLPQPKSELWDGTGATNLRERWRWLLTAKKKTGERYATTSAEGLEWFARFFSYVSESDFLMGREGRWSCDMHWLVKAANFTKVVQGNYENQKVAA